MILVTARGNPLRAGIIGAGRIVERAHLPVLSAMPEVQLAGLFDPDSNRALTLTQQFGISKMCRSLDELLQLGLDLLLVACPNYLHAPMTIAALEHGIHVLCEKPMAINSLEAQAMVEAAERNDRELMIGFTNRFRPEIGVLQQVLQKGKLGEKRSIRCGWLRRSGIPGVGTWFTSSALAGGGALTDLGSHLVDLALWLGNSRELRTLCCVVDQAIDTSAQATWYAPADRPITFGMDVETSATGFAILAGPLSLFIEVSWSCPVPCDQTYIHITGSQGIAKLETLFGFSPSGNRPEYPLRIWVDGESTVQEVAGTTDLLQPYRDQWSYFVDSLRKGHSLRAWLNDSLATVQLIEAMYKSAR